MHPLHLYSFDEDLFEVRLHEPNPAAAAVPEAFVQDLWRAQAFARADLRTNEGQPVVVLDPGTFNTDGGPDFRAARLRIGPETWCGDVEVHVASQGWTDHRHHLDTRYNGVVLHVVLNADLTTGTLRRADGSALPEVVLAPRLAAPLRGLLHSYLTRPADGIACASVWADMPVQERDGWIEALALERVGRKREQLAAAFIRTPDLEILLYEFIMAGLGYSRNADAMRTLARRVPLALTRSAGDPMDLEALLLGAAGLLPPPAALLRADRETADYVVELRHRFERLNARLGITPMPRESWQFFRLRPANFPPLRIAQASALLRGSPPGLLHHDPLGEIRAALTGPAPLDALRGLLSAEPSPFWRTHVRLEKSTPVHPAAIGVDRADALLINAVAPVLLLLAEQASDPDLEARTLSILRQIPPERDEVTRIFERLGTRPRNALAAQGLHQLYRTRCLPARCLTCPVGRHMIEGSATPS